MGFLDSIADNISATLRYNSHKKNTLICMHEQQVLNQYNTHAQLLLQDGLFYVLSKVNISPHLCRLNNAQELLLSGFRFECNTTIYYFIWTKTTSDMIPISMLKKYVQKMNTAIQSECHLFHTYLQQLDYYTQAEYIQLYPALYNGFRVHACKDDNDSIILAVSFN